VARLTKRYHSGHRQQIRARAERFLA